MLDINSRMGTLREIKYPMAGMKSEQISLGVYQVASGKTVFLDVDDFGREQYLTNIAWSPASDYIYVQVLDRAQKHMKLNQYSAKTGEFVKTLLEEQNERYIEPVSYTHLDVYKRQIQEITVIFSKRRNVLKKFVYMAVTTIFTLKILSSMRVGR